MLGSLSLFSAPTVPSRQQISAVFHQFDGDGSGDIDAPEVQAMLTALGLRV